MDNLADKAIRLKQIDDALVHIRQNAAALGYGANLTGDALREEREEIIGSIRNAGEILVEGSIAQANTERARKKAAVA